MKTIFYAWIGSVLAVLMPAALWLRGAFPVFTVAWLAVPLLVVARSGDAHRVGFRGISWRQWLSTTTLNLAGLLVISLAFEPWLHPYQALVEGAMASTPPDTTFAWLVRYEGLAAWGGLLLYSGFVTIFAEEVFFRGWLLQFLLRKMDRAWAIAVQAALFTLPQLLAAFLLTPAQGLVYALLYSWLGVGVIGGWAAARTQSIWPSLVSATLWNAILVAWVL